MPRKVLINAYPDPAQHEALKSLSDKTGVPMNEFIRIGLDLRIRLEEQRIRHGRVLVFEDEAEDLEKLG